MPLFATFVGALLARFSEWLAIFFSKRVALAITVFTFLLAGFLAVYLALSGAVAAVAVVTPTGLVSAFTFVFPANLKAVLSAIFTADSIMGGWQWHKENLKLAAHYVT